MGYHIVTLRYYGGTVLWPPPLHNVFLFNHLFFIDSQLHGWEEGQIEISSGQMASSQHNRLLQAPNTKWREFEVDGEYRGNEWNSSTTLAPISGTVGTSASYNPLRDKHLKFRSSQHRGGGSDDVTVNSGSAPHRRAAAAGETNSVLLGRRPDTVGEAQQRLDIRRQAYQQVVANAVNLAALRDPSFIAATTKKSSKEGGHEANPFDVFERSKGKTVALWGELGIDEAYRHHFSAQYFQLAAGEEPTAHRIESIHAEIERLLNLRRCEKNIEYSIRVREGFLYRLLDLAETSSSLHFTEIDLTMKPLIINLRKATLDVVEAVASWRQALGYNAVYLWRGSSYLLKLAVDLEPLAAFPALVQRFPCTLVGNCLLNLDQPNPLRVVHRSEAAAEKPLMPVRTALLPPILRPAGQQKDGSVIPPEMFARATEMILAEPALFADYRRTTVVHTFDLIDATTYDAHVAKQLKDIVFNSTHAALDFPHLALGAAAAATDELTPHERLMIAASIDIQRVWRGHCARKLTAVRRSQHRAAVKIQRVQRKLLAKSEVDQRRLRHLAAAKIQGVARGVATRGALQRYYALGRVAVVLQTAWRAHRARKWVAYLLAVSRCARTIQRWYRGHLARRWVPQHKLQTYTTAAVQIQRLWKGGALRASRQVDPRAIRAAVSIQTCWRRHHAVVFVAKLRAVRNAAHTIQRFGKKSAAVATNK